MSGDSAKKGRVREERIGGVSSKKRRGYARSVEELASYHPKVFSMTTQMSVDESPILSRDEGLAVFTIRINQKHPDKKAELRRKIAQIYARHPNAEIEFSITADVVSVGPNFDTFGLFFGQDYAERDTSVFGPYVIRSPGDAGKLPTEFSLGDVMPIFNPFFRDSAANVHDVVAMIFIGRHFMKPFFQSKGPGSRHTGRRITKFGDDDSYAEGARLLDMLKRRRGGGGDKEEETGAKYKGKGKGAGKRSKK